MPPVKDKIVRKRTLQKDKYDLKNLKFLGDFMTALGLTTTTAAEKIGLTQVSVYYWLKKDDARLSAVDNLIDKCGFRLSIGLVPVDPEPQSNTEIILELPRMKRLSFLSDALSEQDKQMVAEKLNIGFSTIYYWLEHDDIFISYIYKIAEALDKKVKITIRPK